MKKVHINLCPEMLYWKDVSIQKFMDKIRLTIRSYRIVYVLQIIIVIIIIIIIRIILGHLT